MRAPLPGLISFLVLGLLMVVAPVRAQHPTAVTSIVNSDQDTTLEVNYDGGLLAPGRLDNPTNYTTNNDSIPAEGAGVRLMWYPEKAAFRAGHVDIIDAAWNADNVGFSSVAFGQDTEASGFGSLAIGRTTTASGIQATAMGDRTVAASQNSLTIGEWNSANTGSDFTSFVVGNGSPGSRSDALVLKRNGDLALGPSNPDDVRLHVSKNRANVGVNDNPTGNIVLFKNTNTGTNPDVMGLQAGPSDPGSGTTYLSFYDRNDNSVGRVEGNGSGGIVYATGGSDYAEELPVAKEASVPEPAEVVGVRTGEIRYDTQGADRVMIASRAPAMTGNTTPSTTEDDDRRVPVAFVGQVPARVRGDVQVGDLIVASGKDDGTARAVAPSDYRRARHGPIAGQAWSSKTSEEIGEVTVAVGLGRSGAVASRLQRQRNQIEILKQRVQEIETVKRRLTELESASSGSKLAGGASSGFPIGLLVGGILVVGLVWRLRSRHSHSPSARSGAVER